MPTKPWVTGPQEILEHGLQLLDTDSDKNRRLALLSIDNAVELMIKVYLGLPKRVTGIQIGREKFREISESFPKLLDAIEEHAPGKLDGIDISDIEWYHRLRNELYHQGNGLTVVREKVDVYAALAVLLFANLFGFQPEFPHEASAQQQADGEPPAPERIGRFITAWSQLERLSLEHATAFASFARRRPTSFSNSMAHWLQLGIVDLPTTERLEALRQLRNQVVHQSGGGPAAPTEADVRDLERIVGELQARIAREEQRRVSLLERLRQEYIAGHDGLSPATLAGTELLPMEWVNDRLTELGEFWRYYPDTRRGE